MIVLPTSFSSVDVKVGVLSKPFARFDTGVKRRENELWLLKLLKRPLIDEVEL